MTHDAPHAAPTLRTLLFVPGNQARMLRKALDLAPDAYVPDLEDSVPVAEKESARSVVSGILPELAGAGPLVVPRVNDMKSGLHAFHQQGVDAFLGHRAPTIALLADEDFLGMRTDFIQKLVWDEAVEDHDIGGAQEGQTAHCDQVGATRSGAHQVSHSRHELLAFRLGV